MTLAVQLLRQASRTLACPAQCRLRIAPCRGLDQRIQIAQQGRILGNEFLAPTTGHANSTLSGHTGIKRSCRHRSATEFRKPGMDRCPRQAHRASYGTDATAPETARLNGRPQSQRCFIQPISQRSVLDLDLVDNIRPRGITPNALVFKLVFKLLLLDY